MGELFFSNMFNDYKDGFSNGVVDFIINPLIDVSFFGDINEETAVWDIGYVDAVRYYQKCLFESKDLSFDLSNIFMVISELYIRRVAYINYKFDTNMKAFTLLLSPKDLS